MRSQSGHNDPSAREHPERHTAISRLYNRHGASLYRLAYAICGDVEMACAAVAQAFGAAFTDAGRTSREEQISHDLARRTYLACSLMLSTSTAASARDVGITAGRPSTLDPSRALLALTLHGDRTYNEAALLLDIDPLVAAKTLRAELRRNVPM